MLVGNDSADTLIFSIHCPPGIPQSLGPLEEVDIAPLPPGNPQPEGPRGPRDEADIAPLSPGYPQSLGRLDNADIAPLPQRRTMLNHAKSAEYGTIAGDKQVVPPFVYVAICA